MVRISRVQLAMAHAYCRTLSPGDLEAVVRLFADSYPEEFERLALVIDAVDSEP